MKNNKSILKNLVGICMSLGILSSIYSCKTAAPNKDGSMNYPAFFEIGHRGARGLSPENTIPSMIRAIEAGANTIEVDVHISKDGKVVIYHDASLNPAYTTMPDGTDIPAAERKKYTIYQMPYDSIRAFVVGKKPFAEYPQQERIASYVPLLSELIDSVEAFTQRRQLAPVFYLVEVKSNEKTDGVEQPAPEQYMDILMSVLTPFKLGSRLIVQSFDMRPLQVINRKYPEVALGFLTSDKQLSFEQNITRLGFTPDFYNPHFSLVTPELINACHEKKIRITPWTINTTHDMKRIKALGVDGIITDYPNLLDKI